MHVSHRTADERAATVVDVDEQSIEQFWDDLIGCHADLPALLDVISERVVRLIGDGCVLTMLSRDGSLLDPAAVAHADPAVRDAMRAVLGTQSSRVGEGIAGRVAADRRPVLLNDLEPAGFEETTPQRYRPFLESHPMRALMVVPLLVGNELFGTLGALRTESVRPYTDDDLEALQSLAGRAALAIADAVGPHRPLGSADHDAIFHHCGHGIVITGATGAMVAANPAACTILRMTERQMIEGGLDAMVVAGPELDAALARRAAVGQVRAELTMCRGDGSTVPVDLFSALYTTVHGGIRAVVQFRDLSREVALREAVGRRMEELEVAADVDPMTGLLNRRGFQIAAEKVFAAADRAGHAAQLVFIDLDGLKQVNDEQGHSAGDRAITSVGEAISRSIRTADVACRLGGDEFVILMAGATADETRAVIHRIDEALAAVTPHLSFSSGVTERQPASTRSLDHYVDAADREMYQHKLVRRLRATD